MCSADRVPGGGPTAADPVAVSEAALTGRAAGRRASDASNGSRNERSSPDGRVAASARLDAARWFVDALPVAAALLEADGLRYVCCNAAFQALLLDPGAVAGGSACDVFPPPAGPDALTPIRMALATGRHQRIRSPGPAGHRRMDGGRPVTVGEWDAYPLTARGGAVTHLAIVAATEAGEPGAPQDGGNGNGAPPTSGQRMVRPLLDAPPAAPAPPALWRQAGIGALARRLADAAGPEAVRQILVQAAADAGAGTGRAHSRATLHLGSGPCMHRVAEHDDAGPGTSTQPIDRAVMEWLGDIAGAGEVRILDVTGGQMPAPARRQWCSVGVVRAALIPLSAGSRTLGLLTIGARDARRLDDASVTALLLIAATGAMALTGAERSHTACQEAEGIASVERLKSEFLDLAAHELRGPLSVARGYASMLEDGTFGALDRPAVRFPLLVILRKLADMNELVDRILEAARLEDEEVVLSFETLDLRELAHAVIRAAAPFSPDHTVTLRSCEAPLPVRGDRMRLVGILTNLLDNACKYSPGGGTVEVACGLEGGRAWCAVTDHGIGIRPEHVTRIFSRFGRIVTPENSHIPGTGLGLHLGREVARMHGGDVTVRSEPGVGSTFTMTLPLAD